MTQRAEGNTLAKGFADYMNSKRVRAVMAKNRFSLPAEGVGKAKGGKP